MKMKQVLLGLCLMDQDGSVFNTRQIGTKWSVDLEKDLKIGPNKHILGEIAAIMTENLVRHVKSDTVQEMLEEIQDKDYE
jgi:hypothetical protein